jgi:TRAP-type C4-dicarboxylate transport system permease small subunit
MATFWKVFDRTLNLIVYALYAVLTILAFAQVLVRYVLGGSITWSEEAVRFLFIWLALIGAAITMQREGHIGVKVPVDLFPPRIHRLFSLFADVCILVFAVFLVVQGFRVSQATVANVSPAMQIPMSQFYLILPIAGMLLAINALRVAHRHWTGHPGPGLRED